MYSEQNQFAIYSNSSILRYTVNVYENWCNMTDDVSQQRLLPVPCILSDSALSLRRFHAVLYFLALTGCVSWTMFNRLIRLGKSKYYGALFENHKGDICAKWRTLNYIIGKTRDKTSCINMNIDGELANDPTIISNKLYNYFTKVGHNCAAEIPAAKAPFTHHLRNTRHIRIPFFLTRLLVAKLYLSVRWRARVVVAMTIYHLGWLKSLKGEIAFPLSILITTHLSTVLYLLQWRSQKFCLSIKRKTDNCSPSIKGVGKSGA